MYKRKGISLIVLVITILVMLILSGVVIVSLSKNNPIEKAKEANLKTNVQSLIEEVNMYIANSLEKNDLEKYPVQIKSIEDNMLNIEMKELIAIEQGKFLVNGLPDIYNIDLSNIKLLDKKKIKTAEAFPGEIVLLLDGNKAVLYSLKGVKYKKQIYYRLEDIIEERDISAKYFTDEYNTFKLYENGLLTCVGKKSLLSGATQEEIESMKTGFGYPFISPMGKDCIKEVYGNNSLFGIKKDGTAYVIGNNQNGKYGLGYNTEILVPEKLKITNIQDIFPGQASTFVIKKDGTLWATGSNLYGELGVGDKKPRPEFVQINWPNGVTATDVKQIYSVIPYTAIQTKDNRIYVTGDTRRTGDDLVNPSQTISTFKRIEYPFENTEIKTVKFNYYTIQILLKNGDMYMGEFAKGLADPLIDMGAICLLKKGVREIGEADAEMHFQKFISCITNDNKLYIVGAESIPDGTGKFLRDKTYREVDLKGVDITNAKLISSNRIFVDGKIYSIGYHTTGKPALIYESAPVKENITFASELYNIPIFKDESGNVYIVGRTDLANNIKLIQSTQRKIFGNARYLNAKISNNKINIIDKDYNLWTSLKDKSPKKNVIKSFPNGSGGLGQSELYLNGDVYINEQKVYSNAKDISLNWVYTFFVLTKDNKIAWKGWINSPFATKQQLAPGENQIKNFEIATVPGIPSDAEKIYNTMSGIYILTKGGELYSYGVVNHTGHSTREEKFKKVPLPGKIVYFDTFAKAEIGFAIATLENGEVYAWGDNKRGQFGDGYDMKIYPTPQKLNIKDVSYASAGDGFAIFAKKDGKVYAAGRNEYGQLGTGNTISSVSKFVYSKELSKEI